MVYGYNKSIIGLIDDTYNYIFIKNKDQFLDNKVLFKYYNNIVALIIKFLLLRFNEKFNKVNKLKQIFSKVLSLSNLFDVPVYITINDLKEFQKEGFYQYYYDIEYERMHQRRYYNKEDQIKYNKKYKDITIYIPKVDKTGHFNLKKNINALLPNTCHYIDSTLMYNISTILLENKIEYKTLHDSFYINIQYVSIVKNIYRKEYIKLFEQDLLKKIILNILFYYQINEEFKGYLNHLNIKNITDNFISEFNTNKVIKVDKKYAKIHKNIKEVIKLYNEVIANDDNLYFKNLSNFILENKNDNILK